MASLLVRLFRLIGALWPHRLRNLDRLPNAPCLLVGNHSGGGIIEVFCLASAWHAQVGSTRLVAGLMHASLLRIPVLGAAARSLGAIEATRESAIVALREGRDVIVFPGGEVDSCRPFYAPREVRFGGRRGYARLALEAGVPVVPVVTLGSHWTYLYWPGGERVARMIGMKRWLGYRAFPLAIGQTLFPLWLVASVALHASAWWILIVGAALLLPNPCRVTSEVLPAVRPGDLPDTTTLDERTELLHEQVHGALQARLREMQHGTAGSSS